MRVLVTGGAGFIGSHIVDILIEEQHEVMVIDNLSTGRLENLNKKAEFVEKDIRSDLTHEFEKFKPEVVIHHAAQVDVSASMKDPIKDCDINIAGTINLLNYCANIRKIIYASSAAVYGKPVYLSIDENHPISPLSFYGISKYTPEHYIKQFSTINGFEFTILRYANVFGSRQSTLGEGGVISIFLEKVLSGNAPSIHGDGNQTRDFIFVKDVARANLLALTKGRNQVFNISTNQRTSINELYNLITNAVNKGDIKPLFSESRLGDIDHSVLDNTAASKELNWEPHYSLVDGIREAAVYYHKQTQSILDGIR